MVHHGLWFVENHSKSSTSEKRDSLMNHLNLFLPFENKDANHEDILTRNFLFMIRAVPAVRKMFSSLILAKTKHLDALTFDSIPESFEIKEAYTQVDYRNQLFNRVDGSIILSTLISDDALDTEHQIATSVRHARYDGVLICKPDLWIIIENKPFVGNVWEGQLDINLSGIGHIVNLVRRPCCLSWRDIVAGFNGLLHQNALNETEKVLVEDFLLYIDEKFVGLNPFDRLDLCKDTASLIDKRCCSILKEIGTGEIKYHRGWGYYISCDNPMIKKIALKSKKDGNLWSIHLKMHFGVTQSASQKLYANINVDKLEDLLRNDAQMSAIGAFHYAVQADNVFFPEGVSNANTIEYVKYWKQKNEQGHIHQIKRSSFVNYHQQLIVDNVVSATSMTGFQQEIMAKRYPALNVCPELQICCTWSKEDAIELDKMVDLLMIRQRRFSQSCQYSMRITTLMQVVRLNEISLCTKYFCSSRM